MIILYLHVALNDRDSWIRLGFKDKKLIILKIRIKIFATV